MRKPLKHIGITGILFMGAISLAGCFKDNCSHSYKIFTPVYSSIASLRKEVKSLPPQPLANPGKIYLQGTWIYVNEKNRGIHVIDNTDPARPVNKAFVNIPGNMDLAIRGNTLYADLYSDLAAIDISSRDNISAGKFLGGIFPYRIAYSYSANPDSQMVITGWKERDTTVSCATVRYWQRCPNCYLYSSAYAAVPAPAGTGGSMARFAAAGNYLYAVSTSDLNVVDISTPANPVFTSKTNVGWNIETLYPFNGKLFIGAGASMSVYDLTNPAQPKNTGRTSHWCSGDPVIADEKYAYVTLHEANICSSQVNQLEIYDLQGAGNPVLLQTYRMTNPQGLSKDGNLLFICDGKDGLKVYNAADVKNLSLVMHITGINTYDVIALNGIACVITTSGLYQYDYRDAGNIRLISKLGWNE